MIGNTSTLSRSTQIQLQPSRIQVPFSDGLKIPFTNIHIAKRAPSFVTIPASLQPSLGLTAAKVTHHPLLLQPLANDVTASLENESAGFRMDSLRVEGRIANATIEQLNAMQSSDQYLNQFRTNLLQALVYFREGEITQSLKLVNDVLSTLDHVINFIKHFKDEEAELMTQALMLRMDLHLAQAFTHQNEMRNASLVQVVEDARLIGSVALPKITSETKQAELSRFLSQFLGHMVSEICDLGYPVHAVSIANEVLQYFPNSPCAEQLKSSESPLYDRYDSEKMRFTEDGSSTWIDKVWAGLTNSIYHAQFRTNEDFWKLAIYGGVAGALLDGALQAVSLDPQGTGGLAMVAMVGTSVVAAGKAYLGITAPETRQAYLSGKGAKSFSQFMKSGVGRSVEMLGTWIMMGGAIANAAAIPTVGHLPFLGDPVPGVFLAERDGLVSLHGLGTMIDGSREFISYHLSILNRASMDHGLVSGLDIWKETVRAHSPGWNSFFKGWDYAFQFADSAVHAVGNPLQTSQDLAKQASDFISEQWNNSTSSELLGKAAMSVVAMLSGAYATVGLVSPRTIAKARNQSPEIAKYAEPALFVGALAVAVEFGVWTGVSSYDAWRIPLVAILGEIVRQKLSSGKWSIPDWSALSRAGVTQFLYAGPGKALAPDQSTYLDPNQITIGEKAGVFIGMFPWMFAIGGVHAIIQGTNFENMMKFKLAQAPTYELAGVILRLTFGWATWQGVAGELGVKYIFTAPATLKSYNSNAGAPAQIIQINKSISDLKKAKAQGASQFEKALSEFERNIAYTARRWNFSAPFTGQTFMERLPIFTAYKWADTTFNTTQFMHFYRVTLLNILTDPDADVATLLDAAQWMAQQRNPLRRDIAANILMTVLACRNGPHADRINDFIKTNETWFRYYDLNPAEQGWLPESRGSWFGARAFNALLDGLELRQKFNDRLVGQKASADGLQRISRF